MTFGSAESELFSIVSDKHDPVARIHRRRAEMTCVNSHGNAIVKWLEEDGFFHISRKKKYCDEMGQSHRLPIWDRSIFAAVQGKEKRSTKLVIRKRR